MSLIPIEYDLDLLEQDLIALLTKLPESRMREVGWIEMAFKNVNYPRPEDTEEVRESTRQLGAALAVLYYIVTIEHHFPVTYKDFSGNQRNLWQECNDYGWLSDADLEILRAFRHVRHSYAHSSDGTHARQNRTSFDNVVANTPHLMTCISSDGVRVSVGTGAGVKMVDILTSVLQQLLSRMSSTPRFGPKL